MTISAKVVVASRREEGAKITTLQLRYPRFIHAEFMTHRMFSRNASSSRAIPVARLIDDVINDTAMPIHWGKNQPGMQAGAEINEPVSVIFPCKPSGGSDYPGWLGLTPASIDECDVSLETGDAAHPEGAWQCAAYLAVYMARRFDAAGYHKQIVNRLLEPFSHINVIVTATEWENFFALRLHPDAQPEIQELARVMKEAIDGASYELLGNNMWHRPYVTPEERITLTLRDQCLVSAARCARVSYMTHEGKAPEVEADLQLAERLLTSKHMSPFEHQAMVYGMNTTPFFNLRGFRSFRMDLDQ